MKSPLPMVTATLWSRFGQKIRWTYAQLKGHADQLAAGLLELGLVPGDRLGIWSPNRAEWAVVQFAAAKAGLILVNIIQPIEFSSSNTCFGPRPAKRSSTAAHFKSSRYLDMIASPFAHGNEANAGLAFDGAKTFAVIFDFED